MKTTVKENETGASRRRVEELLSGHLRTVAPLLVAQGLESRTALGFWHASMGSLVSGVGAQAAAKLIAARSKSIRGHGQNADVAVSEMTPATEVQILAEVSATANEFVEAIGGAYEDAVDAELEHLFAEVLVDVLAKTLEHLWGPYHTRKAFGDQWLYFGAGRELVVHPAEPAEPPQVRKPAPSPAIIEDDRPPLSPAGRPAGDRHADLRVEAEVEGASAAFAVAIETSEKGGRRERRDIVGPCPDASVRKAVLTAAVEGLAGVLERAGKVSFRVTSSSAFLQAGMLPSERRKAGCRLPTEDGLWASLDAFAMANKIEWRLAPESMADDLAERCDRLLRRQLAR